VIAGMVFEAFLCARGKPFPRPGFLMPLVISDTGPVNRRALVSGIFFFSTDIKSGLSVKEYQIIRICLLPQRVIFQSFFKGSKGVAYPAPFFPLIFLRPIPATRRRL